MEGTFYRLVQIFQKFLKRFTLRRAAGNRRHFRPKAALICLVNYDFYFHILLGFRLGPTPHFFCQSLVA